MSGLYVLKPWYANRLAVVRTLLVRHHVAPHMITVFGVVAGGGAGAALWLRGPGPITAVVLFVLLAVRLAAANLDGGVARAANRSTRTGSVVNEVGDRLAEYAALAGVLAIAPTWLAVVAALAGTLPSWVALAGAAAGADRVQGGPVGKTERCVLIVVLAATGWVLPILAVFAIGSLLTAGVRLRRIGRALAERDLADRDFEGRALTQGDQLAPGFGAVASGFEAVARADRDLAVTR